MPANPVLVTNISSTNPGPTVIVSANASAQLTSPPTADISNLRTFAELPTLDVFQGTVVYTTDQGICVYNGTNWAPIGSFGNAVLSVAGMTGNVTLTATNIGGLAPSATTDTTNASNITSGTLDLAQLPTIPASDLSGLAPSATTDTTNAANITSGFLPVQRLPLPDAIAVSFFGAL